MLIIIYYLLLVSFISLFSSQYIFTDTVHRQIWMTFNSGDTFSYVDVPFAPTTISMHKTDINIVLATDEHDGDKVVSTRPRPQPGLEKMQKKVVAA